jgi:hypothetical protein
LGCMEGYTMALEVVPIRVVSGTLFGVLPLGFQSCRMNS